MPQEPMNKTPLSYAELEVDASGTPSSTQHNDVYFSRGQGVAESRYVFLQHNFLPARWHTLKAGSTWVIAETGFGTGLNFFTAATDFLQHAPAHTQLHYVSFEKYPLHASDLTAIASHWPEFDNISQATAAHYPELIPGLHRLQLHPRITLDLIFGDVLDTLPDWAAAHENMVDSWFLDGFAPSKNPTMWQPVVYQSVFKSLKAQGTLATFTATGHVRRGLEAAGLSMKKARGFGYKRDMLCGTKPTLATPAPHLPKSIAILGGGIAAASVATELRDFSGPLTLVWGAKSPADGASGNPQAAIYPLLQADWTLLSHLNTHAFCFSRTFYQQHVPHQVHWTGVELLERSAEDKIRQQKIIQRQLYPTSIVQAKAHSLLMPTAGWLNPLAVVSELFQQLIQYRETRGLPTQIIKGQPVKSLERIASQWHIETNSGSYQATNVVLCVGHSLGLAEQAVTATHIHSRALAQANLPIRPVRGQISLLQAGTLENLQHVVCEKGYVLPPQQGVLCTGATFDQSDHSANIKESDNAANIDQLNSMMHTNFQAHELIGSRASVRATTPDHIPIQGPLVRASACGKETVSCPGLSVLLGLGSRGFTTAPWLAHAVACNILGKPLPFGERIAKATGTRRFLQRAQARTN